MLRFFAGFLTVFSLVVPKTAAAQPAQGTTSAQSSTQQKPSHTGKTTKTAAKRKRMSPRVRRVRQAFVASASLRRMAQQLLQDRTAVAYAGVEGYARRHAKEDAGALAWLVVGYAHTLDHEYAKAIDPLNRAKAGASELGDYVAYNLGNAYLQSGHTAEALSTLADFGKNFPGSLLTRDVHLAYATALIQEDRPHEAAFLLEKDRSPVRSDIELTIGRAYEASGEHDKAGSGFRNVYFNMPTSSEAEIAGAELHKLGISGTVAERRTRADLLFKAKRYADAAHDYHDLLDEVSADERPSLQLTLATALEKSGRSREARQIVSSMSAVTGD